MPSREVSTRVIGLTTHENMDNPLDFPHAARLTRVTLETSFSSSGFWNFGIGRARKHSRSTYVSHQNLGNIKRYGNILLAFCSQCISRKSHGSVPKKFKQFRRIGITKPGLRVNYPPTCNTRVITAMNLATFGEYVTWIFIQPITLQ